MQRSQVDLFGKLLVGLPGALERAFFEQGLDRIELRILLPDPFECGRSQLDGGNLASAQRGQSSVPRRGRSALQGAHSNVSAFPLQRKQLPPNSISPRALSTRNIVR
jgi:hypothetical protein